MSIEVPLFSVIVPCYNSWRFMERGLRSLEQQTFNDFEVIFIDDCSVDDTYIRLVEYQQKSKLNIGVLKNDKNSGPGQSRNNGIRQAKGEYITFMDSDDWYETNFLNVVHREISTKNTDIVVYDYYRCFSTERGKAKKVLINHTAPLVACKSKEDCIALATDSLCSIVVKRVLFQKVSIANLYNAEDAITIPVLISSADKFSFLSTPLYNYNYRYGSLSTAIDPRTVDNFWDAFIFLHDNLKEEYREAFEFHCVKVVAYGLLHNAVRCKIKNKVLNKKLEDFQLLIPNWYNNKYIHYLPFRKIVWLRFVKMRCFIMLRLYYQLQRVYFKCH